MTKPLIIAHRGASYYAPENTMASVKLAWGQNTDALEVDVHKTKDGKLVVHHDKKINTRFFSPTIAKTNLKRLKTYKIGLNEQIPTLKEALSILKGNIILDIEVKPVREKD